MSHLSYLGDWLIFHFLQFSSVTKSVLTLCKQVASSNSGDDTVLIYLTWKRKQRNIDNQPTTTTTAANLATFMTLEA